MTKRPNGASGSAEASAPGPTHSSAGSWAKKLGLALASLALAMMLLELIVRIALPAPRFHDRLLEIDSELGFRGVPGYEADGRDKEGRYRFALNEEGFRGPLLAERASSGQRLLFLGDSFLVGEALREEALLTSRVSAALASRGEPVSVHNLAVVDYGTAQQLLLLRKLGPKLEPTAVVLAFYTGNDLANNGRQLAGLTEVSPGDYIRPYLADPDDEVEWTHPLRAALRNRSRLIAHVDRVFIAMGNSPWPPRLPVQRRLELGQPVREDLGYLKRYRDPGNRWERAWRASLALLRGIRDECDSLGARLLVLVIPSADQVERRAPFMRLDATSLAFLGQPADAKLDWNYPDERLRRFFDSESIDAILLLPELRALARSGANVYTRDLHLDSEAQALAAERVLAWFDEREAWPSPDAIEGKPVSRLPALNVAPSELDFRSAAHWEYFGHGWLTWSGDGEQRGVRLATTGLVMVPDHGGSIRLRVSAPSGPIRGFTRVGTELNAFEVAERESLEITLDPGPSARLRSREGYLPVIIGAQPMGGLWLEEIRVDLR